MPTWTGPELPAAVLADLYFKIAALEQRLAKLEHPPAAIVGNAKPSPDDLLTTAEVAKILGWHEGTLRRKRCRGEDSPDYIKVGRYCMYRRADIEAWKTSHIKRPRKA